MMKLLLLLLSLTMLGCVGTYEPRTHYTGKNLYHFSKRKFVRGSAIKKNRSVRLTRTGSYRHGAVPKATRRYLKHGNYVYKAKSIKRSSGPNWQN